MTEGILPDVSFKIWTALQPDAKDRVDCDNLATMWQSVYNENFRLFIDAGQKAVEIIYLPRRLSRG